jgi:uncharacterized protein YecT (DUF1311 family)
MRASMLAVMILLLSVAPPVQADIVAACYTDCAAETDSNPDLKACLTRAANKADRLLNESYKTLQDAIRKSTQEVSQSPDEALASLTTTNGSATAMPIAPSRKSCLRRHGDRRQLFGLPLRAEL